MMDIWSGVSGQPEDNMLAAIKLEQHMYCESTHTSP